MITTTPPAPLNRIQYMDTLRAIAIILMIIVHVAAPLLYEYATLPTWWWIGNVFDTLARPCVPLFVMLSGALLLSPNKVEPLGVFFRKRFQKVLIPFIAWQVIYIFWRALLQHQPVNDWNAFLHILDGPSYYHLWFMFVLIGLYLATPILRVFIRAASEQDLRYFLLLWLSATSLLPLLSKFLNINVGITFFVAVGYAGYFVLGHYLNCYAFFDQKLKWLGAAAAVSALVSIFGTYGLLLQNGGKLDEFFYNYLNLAVVILTVFLFVYFKTRPLGSLFSSQAAGGRLLAVLSSTSFGIYLIHIIILEILSHGYHGLRINAYFINPLVSIPLTTLLVLTFSAIAVLIIQKIPVLRRIV